MTVVLDAWAVLALLQDEPAAERVEGVVDEREAVLSVVALGEALSNLIPRVGERRASAAVAGVRSRVRLEPADWPLTVLAARLKARHRLSYPDAFCVATAQRHRAPLWTGDPEILALGEAVEMVDLR